MIDVFDRHRVSAVTQQIYTATSVALDVQFPALLRPVRTGSDWRANPRQDRGQQG
jgi:hypothetical protein